MISVVTSVYNKGLWLSRFIKSILGQTHSDFEFIIVDNASTDGSSIIIDSFAQQDSRIRIIRLLDNRGPSGGIREGMKMVTGDYFTILDADDYVDSDFLEILYRNANSYDADVSMCVNDLVWDDGRSEHKPWPSKSEMVIECSDIKKLPCQLLDELNNSYFGDYIPEIGAQWAKLVRTSIVRDNGIEHDPSIWTWNDWVFNMQIIKHVSRFVYTKETVYHFYQDNESVTRVRTLSPLYKERFLHALEKMQETVSDIMSPELSRALNVFRFRLINYIFDYYYSFFPSDINRREMIDILADVSLSSSYKELVLSDYVRELSRQNQQLIVALSDSRRLSVYLTRSQVVQLLRDTFERLRLYEPARKIFHFLVK